MKRINVFEENKILREELNHERRLRKEWKEKYYSLDKKYKELEAKLNILLNSNTPSSQLPFTEKSTNTSPNRNPKGTNPRGKPKGGNGGTKNAPKKYDKEEKATADKCSKCKGHKLKHVDTEKIPVWDLPIIKLIVTLFYRYIYVCLDCGEIVYGTHPLLPKEGMIGPNLSSFLAELKHNFAVSYEKLSFFLKGLTGETFTAQGIKDCIRRVASTLKPSYKKIEDKIKEEKVINSDETKWPINGNHFYLWLLTSLKFVFITINESRGRKVITDILGEFFKGVVVSDCLTVYRKFAAAFQKCWAHLLRRTYWLKEKHPKSDVKKLHEQLSSLFDEAGKCRKLELDKSQRIWNAIILNQKLQRIIAYRWKSKWAKGIIDNWLKEYEGHWLVGVMIPEVELTNNKDERGIRKVIPTRKMLGGHRTEQGAKDFAIIETHRQTWILNGKSSYNMMVDTLMKENKKVIVA